MASTDYTEGNIPIGGIDVHYYRMGTPGRAPVVFLHGFSDGGLTWLRLAGDLGLEYDLVMLDAVGHGKSGGVEHGFRERAASDVLAAIERLELDRPAVVGHSMGAGTASAVAVRASDRLRGVALEDPGWRDGDRPPTLGASPDATGSRAPLRSPAWIDWIQSVKAMSTAERHAHADAERPQWDAETRHNWIDIKAQFNLAILDVAAGGMRTAPPWRDTVSAITCPILLITGDPARGGIVTPAVAEEARRLARDLRVVAVPEVGHNIHRDNYPPYREAVAAFLREVLG
jgi:pimeloyl-ACP methyl ester carboxylesterase